MGEPASFWWAPSPLTGGRWPAPRGTRWSSNRRSHGGSASPTPTRRRRAAARRVLTVGFVNNMPDAAFEDTYQQFAGLLGAGDHDFTIELRGYRLPRVPRGEATLRAASLRYEDVACLYADPPDALIITGLEPKSAHLAAEPYWEDLAHLLRWAEATVPSTILSCLASHAAALALDGIERRPLPTKQSGVFGQDVDAEHPLGEGLERRVSLHIPATTTSRLRA